MDEAPHATLRALFVCGSDFRSPTEKVALGYAIGLVERGHEVAIAMRGDPDSVRAELDGSIPESLTIFAYRFRGPLVAAPDRNRAARFRADVVHAFNPRHDVITAVRGLNRAHAPVVVHFEDDEWGLAAGDATGSLARRLARALARRLARAYPPLWRLATPASLRWVKENATGLEAITPELADHISSRIGRQCSVLLPVHPAVARASPDVAKPPLPADLSGRDLVVFTGAVFAPQVADFRLLVAAMGELKRRGSAAALIYAGTAAPRFDLRGWAREADLEDGDFVPLGYIGSAQLQGLLQRATVLVQPGAPSAFNRLRLPSKLQTYLASGTPTVTFGCGAGKLLKDRSEVLKTHGDDPGELADRIEELLGDESLRARLRMGGPCAAERLFDLHRNTAALIDIYRQAVGCRSGVGKSRSRSRSHP